MSEQVAITPGIDPFQQIELWLEEYQELDMYEYLFESDDPESAAVVEKNAQIADKSVSLLQKLINGLKAAIKKIKDTLARVFGLDGAKLSKDEKEDYKKMVAEMQADPEFAGKTLSIDDYRQIVKWREEECQTFEKEYEQFKNSNDDDCPKLSSKIKEALGKYGKQGASAGVALSAAFTLQKTLEYAKESEANAREIQKRLDWDFVVLGVIEKELSKKEVQKFKKTIRKLSHRSWIMKGIIAIRTKIAEMVENSRFKIVRAVGEAYKDFKEKTKHARTAAKVYNMAKHSDKHGKDVKDMRGELVKGAMHTYSQYREGKKDLKAEMRGQQDAIKNAEKEQRYQEKSGRNMDKKLDKQQDRYDQLESDFTAMGKESKFKRRKR